jgi:hypothetical protein
VGGVVGDGRVVEVKVSDGIIVLVTTGVRVGVEVGVLVAVGGMMTVPVGEGWIVEELAVGVGERGVEVDVAKPNVAVG